MTPPMDSARPPLPVREPGAVPLLVPHLLGFEPARSLVVVGLSASKRVVLSLRWDIPVDEAFTDEALRCYHPSLPAVRRAGAAAAVVVLFPGRPGSAWDDDVPHGGLPLRRLVLGVAEALRDLDVHVQDAMCVAGDRWCSYLCDDPGCCPPEGRPVDAVAALPAVAELVAAGSAPLPSREALVEALEPRSAEDPLVRDVRRVRDASLLRLPTDPVARVEKVVADVERWGARPGAGTVPSRLVALVGFLCSGITTRDLLLRRLAVGAGLGELHALRLVLTEAVRCAPGESAAAPAAVLAVAAYLCGDGAAARVAVERSLRADERYSLAVLVARMLDEGVPPAEWKSVLSGLSVRSILDAARPAPRSEPA